ncbi:MAG: hypothetical protein ACPG49_09595 [Chitinophagales bacterium]
MIRLSINGGFICRVPLAAKYSNKKAGINVPAFSAPQSYKNIFLKVHLYVLPM